MAAQSRRMGKEYELSAQNARLLECCSGHERQVIPMGATSLNGGPVRKDLRRENMPTMTKYAAETLLLAEERTKNLAAEVLVEVDRLLRSGAVDPDDHSRGLLLGVAIENISDRWLIGERGSKSYKNLKHF